MKKLIACFAIASLLALGGAAIAESPALLDNVPIEDTQQLATTVAELNEFNSIEKIVQNNDLIVTFDQIGLVFDYGAGAIALKTEKAWGDTNFFMNNYIGYDFDPTHLVMVGTTVTRVEETSSAYTRAPSFGQLSDTSAKNFDGRVVTDFTTAERADPHNVRMQRAT